MDNYYYSLNNLESRGANVTFVLGSRGNGKSYSAKKKMIELFLKKKKESIYMRRHVNELEGVMLNIFDDVIQNEYPDLNLQLEGSAKTGYYYTINEQPFCHLFNLKTAFKKKGVAYPNVDFIFFDEYIAEDGVYLKNEGEMILSLTSTIFRNRENWRLHFASNSISYVNPIFEMFKIQPRGNQNFYTRSEKNSKGEKKTIFALEITGVTQYEKDMQDSTLGLFAKIAGVSDYMFSNTVLRDNNEHIVSKKPTGYDFFMLTFLIGNKNYGLWTNNTFEDIYVDDKFNPNESKFTRYYIFQEDKKEGYLDLKYYRSNLRDIKFIKKKYAEGSIMFKNQSIKQTFLNEIYPYL